MRPARGSRRKIGVAASWLVAAAVVAAGAISIFSFNEAGGRAAFGMRATPTPPPAATPAPTPTVISLTSDWQNAILERRRVQLAVEERRLGNLRDVVSFAANDVGAWSEDAQVSIAVAIVDGTDRPVVNRMVGADESRVVPSASLAKAYWVAAAADAGKVAAEDPGEVERAMDRLDESATGVFRWSSNEAATTIVKSVGVDGINEFTQNLEMGSTFLRQWGSGQRSSDQNPVGDGNTTSVTDAVRFLDVVASGKTDDPTVDQRLRDWMKSTPDNLAVGEFHGVMGDRLPAPVASELMHKAGWLPPNCCGEQASTLIAMGLLLFETDDANDAETVGEADDDMAYRVPEGAQAYAMAISVNGGSNYERQQDYVAWASCLIYQALADASHACGNVTDR